MRIVRFGDNTGELVFLSEVLPTFVTDDKGALRDVLNVVAARFKGSPLKDKSRKEREELLDKINESLLEEIVKAYHDYKNLDLYLDGISSLERRVK